jgi:hypothetical protein
MGNGGGSVGPGRPTPYVPSAVLLVRRRAVGRGFDAELQIGEDVDLVWRLAKAGWRVLYAPDTHVWHDHRVRLGAFVARRRVYASSVAPLARRHPAALPAARFNVRMILPWTLSILGHRRSAFVVAAGGYLSFGHKLTRVTTCRPYLLAGTLFSRGLLATGLALAHRNSTGVGAGAGARLDALPTGTPSSPGGVRRPDRPGRRERPPGPDDSG